MKVEVAVLGSPSLIQVIVRTFSVDVKQHSKTGPRSGVKREVELGSRSELDSPWLPVPAAGCPD